MVLKSFQLKYPFYKISFNYLNNHYHIISNLTLGSIDGLYSFKPNENIAEFDTILSITPISETPLPGKYLGKCLRYPISFKMDVDNICNIVSQVVDVIHDLQNKNMNTYIHCYEGVSRSAVCVIYYLVKYHNMTMNEAYDFVKQRRSNISPNPLMIQVLEKLCSSK